MESSNSCGAEVWQADDALFGACDREVIGHLLTDVAGDQVAPADH